jgi:hypothetical protein
MLNLAIALPCGSVELFALFCGDPSTVLMRYELAGLIALDLAIRRIWEMRQISNWL